MPENFNKTLLAKMNKLSNKGWSYHLRLLRMDQHALTYFRNVPKDYDGKCIGSLKVTNREHTWLPICGEWDFETQGVCAAEEDNECERDIRGG